MTTQQASTMPVDTYGRYLVGNIAGEWNPAEGRLWLERAAAQGITDAEPDLAALISSASV